MLSQVRFNIILKGMTSAAKKVFDAVPSREAWSVPQIVAEMARTNVQLEYKIIAGCLDTLKNAGLISEVPKGQFKRVAVRKKTDNKPLPPAEEPPVMAHPAPALAPVKPQHQGKEKTAIDRLGELAARVSVISNELVDLAGDISEVAIEIQAKLETNDSELGKLHQLQTLLKSIGT